MSYTAHIKSKAAALAAVAVALAGLSPAAVDAQSRNHEVTVTVISLKSIDNPDAFSKADFFARVTIGKEAPVSTQPMKQAPTIRPNWKITKSVPPGVTNVKLEILDKDLTRDDPIDVNAVDKKRDLDFTIDTRNCRVSGFSSTYKCGTDITRTGKEKKAATVVFEVTVKR